jgi:hypothetical protein
VNALAALAPPLVVAAAFIAVMLAVKRHNDRDVARDRAENGPPSDPRAPRFPAPGPPVRVVPVTEGRCALAREAGISGKANAARQWSPVFMACL